MNLKNMYKRFRDWQRKDHERARKLRQKHKTLTKSVMILLVAMGYVGVLLNFVFAYTVFTHYKILLPFFSIEDTILLSIVMSLFIFGGVFSIRASYLVLIKRIPLTKILDK